MSSMKIRSLIFGLMFFSVSTALFAANSNSIQVVRGSGWVRWLPNGIAAGYLTLKNRSAQPIELVAVSSPDYAQVNLHQTVSVNSMSRMMPIDKLTIPAYGQAVLAPGGYHLMLEQPKRDIIPGHYVQLRLKFADQQKTLNVSLPVRSPRVAR